MKNTICLTMIVKNEADFIEKSLQSIKKYIDYYVICDTGSTDNTIDIIKKTMANTPGEVLSHKWVDFSTNRNLAIEASRNKTDYILIMDADDKFNVNSENLFTNLKLDVYDVKILHGNIEYYRPQLLRSSLNFKYVGVLHEYIEIPQGSSRAKLENCYIQYNKFKSNRNKNSNKYQDDAAVLERALLTEPNNSRYVFYLAQSYRDCANDSKCIENYEKRAAMGGWNQEVFVSLLEAAKAKQRLNYNMFEVEMSYLKAAYYLQDRAAEAYYNLSRYFRLHNNYNKSLCYAKEALKYNKPKDGLFLDYTCYDYKILDELACCLHQMGDLEAAKKIYENILTLNIPESEKMRFNVILKGYKMQNVLNKFSIKI